MRHAYDFAIIRAGKILFSGTLVAALYISFITLGPIIETKYFPVAVYTEFKDTQPGDGIANFSVVIDKVRNCEFVGSSWYLGNLSGTFERIRHNYGNPPFVDTTRPVGTQFEKNWTLDIPPDSKSDEVFSVLHHRCGLPWITTTIQGPFKIEGKP